MKIYVVINNGFNERENSVDYSFELFTTKEDAMKYFKTRKSALLRYAYSSGVRRENVVEYTKEDNRFYIEAENWGNEELYIEERIAR